MLRIAARRTAIGLGGLTVVGASSAGIATYAYTNEEQRYGYMREYHFWRKVLPVVFDYLWKTSSSSPYVRYNKYLLKNDDDDDDEEKEKIEKEKRKELFNDLHQLHAPEIFNVMLELKGLYIKLGQVLSVTTLPIPEPYRKLFRKLQSDVPGWENFNDVVKPIIEAELGKPIDEIFAYVDPVPCGAASIGQAHRAILKNTNKNDKQAKDNGTTKEGVSEQQQHEEEVVIKVQYPDASWQVPADIRCIGDLLKICVYFGIVDELGASLSFNEFSNQFILELDYNQERSNLQTIYDSSIDYKNNNSPYRKRGIIIPKVYNDLCTNRIITMKYLPGPKLEEEAMKQLALLGIDTSSRNLRKIVTDITDRTTDTNAASSNNENDTKNGGGENNDNKKSNHQQQLPSEKKDSITNEDKSSEKKQETIEKSSTWKISATKLIVSTVGFDNVFKITRFVRHAMLLYTTVLVDGIHALSVVGIPIKNEWRSWAETHRTSMKQTNRLSLTSDWIDALFDIHGHQIFNLGLFNSDPHPGNILVIDKDEEDTRSSSGNDSNDDDTVVMKRNMLGLIDYGQCKRLNENEQIRIAKLIVSIANDKNSDKSDEVIAANFRDLGIKTKNNSTKFLANFARLMFGPLLPKHLDHSWHMKFHEMDKVIYFPTELSMVYRTSLLLRGLALSLQLNISVSGKWKDHAQSTLDRHHTTHDHNDQIIIVTPALETKKGHNDNNTKKQEIDNKKYQQQKQTVII